MRKDIWPFENEEELKRSRISEEWVGKYSRIFADTFGEDEMAKMGVIVQHFWNLVKDIDLLYDKRILDIGCGAPKNYPESNGYEPWLARALTAIGSKVTGIDICNAPNEKYEHIQMNLVTERLENKLKNRNFDLAISFNFFDDPTLWSNWLRPRNIRHDEFFSDISNQVFQLLDKGGIYLVNSLNDDVTLLKDIGFTVINHNHYEQVVRKPVNKNNEI